MTARKLPSRTTLTTPGIFSTAERIDALEHRAVARRPHDPAMHHAVGAEILHEGFAAGHLGRNIDARNAPVEEFVLAGSFSTDCGDACTCSISLATRSP